MNALDQHLNRHWEQVGRKPKPLQPRYAEGPCVYVLEVNGLPGWLKVGHTVRLANRLSDYRCHTPLGVTVVAQLVCDSQRQAKTLEKRIHAELIERDLKGEQGGEEWFKDTRTTRGILWKHGMK